jgi:hypothetical protein
MWRRGQICKINSFKLQRPAIYEQVYDMTVGDVVRHLIALWQFLKLHVLAEKYHASPTTAAGIELEAAAVFIAQEAWLMMEPTIEFTGSN